MTTSVVRSHDASDLDTPRCQGECFAPIPALQGCRRSVIDSLLSVRLMVFRSHFRSRHDDIWCQKSWCEALSSIFLCQLPRRGKSGGSPSFRVDCQFSAFSSSKNQEGEVATAVPDTSRQLDSDSAINSLLSDRFMLEWSKFVHEVLRSYTNFVFFVKKMYDYYSIFILSW